MEVILQESGYIFSAHLVSLQNVLQGQFKLGYTVEKLLKSPGDFPFWERLRHRGINTPASRSMGTAWGDGLSVERNIIFNFPDRKESIYFNRIYFPVWHRLNQMWYKVSLKGV